MELTKEQEFVKKLVDQLRPFIQRDGGDMRFISFEDGILTINFLGACIGCGSAEDHGAMIKEVMMGEIPIIKDVLFV
jgi:Fe-S cluster biogenesis protein NfuA